MCGIYGVLQLGRGHSLCDTERIARQMIGMMSRRGPDDAGIWTDGHHCTLGFCRLAILDLSPASRQPMLTPDGRYVIVYNGEVYNFRELRTELERAGIRFRSTGDTEVVLNALALWGTSALQKFNGMFALGFYDSLEKRLLLARDYAGIKPLYYMLTPNGLVFASQYDQIMAHPWSRHLPISSEGLAIYMRLGYIPAPYAILEHTHMLEPGTWLEINSKGAVRRGRFFEFPQYREPDLFGEEAFETVDAVITEAVRRHMISDVPLGAFLSGGIDSPLVVAKMKTANNGPVKAFTIGVSDKRFDEAPDAIRYAQEIGVDHVVEYIQPENGLEMLDDVVKACSEPFADYSIFPTMLISKLARRHVKVMLSGDGGDELFWGYPSRFSSVIQKADEFHQPLWWRTVRRGMAKYFHVGRADWNLRWPTIGDWYRAKHTKVGDSLLYALFPELPSWPESCPLFQFSSAGQQRTAQWLRWNEFTWHLNMVLLKVDRASMYHSLEVRVPLLDKELIEISTRIDWRTCLDHTSSVGKRPLRWALARHTNSQTSEKRGFSVPMDEWLRGPLRPAFEEMVLSRRDFLGLSVRRELLQHLYEKHLNAEHSIGGFLWLLLSLSLWDEHYFRKRHALLV